MKTIVTTMAAIIAAVFMLALVSPAYADKTPITITGEGMCAKCSLHETDKCQNVIQVHEGDKTVNYYLVGNHVSKSFHENLCHDNHKVTATGTVKEVDGKRMFTATTIDLVK